MYNVVIYSLTQFASFTTAQRNQVIKMDVTVKVTVTGLVVVKEIRHEEYGSQKE